MRIIEYSGVKDYSPIIQNEICNLKAGEKLIVEGGTMICMIKGWSCKKEGCPNFMGR